MKQIVGLMFFLLVGSAQAASLQLLADKTGADETPAFSVDEGRAATVVYWCGTYTASEYADIQFTKDDGSNYADLYIDGVPSRLHNGNRMITVYGPGTFRVVKDSSTNACGIYLSRKGSL